MKSFSPRHPQNAGQEMCVPLDNSAPVLPIVLHLLYIVGTLYGQNVSINKVCNQQYIHGVTCEVRDKPILR